MSETPGTVTTDTTTPTTSLETCAQCSKTLDAGDRVASGGRVFCRSCYTSLRAELQQTVSAMSTDISYSRAAVGALLGGAAGALAWWGFTVLTHIGFGLIAVAIGFLVGYGTVRFADGKRSAGLQLLSTIVAVVSFGCATYLVNMSFLNRALSEEGETFRLAFPPASLEQFFRVVTVDFGVMDFVFLAIVVYEAWKIPKPYKLPPDATA